MKKIFSLFIPLVFLFQGFYGQSGYHVTIAVRDYPYDSLLITSYYGDRVISVDTALSAEDQVFTFQGDSLLPGGIYMAVSQRKSKLFEFIMGADQHFSLVTDTLNYVREMKVTDSQENELFYQFLQMSERNYRLNQQYVAKLNSLQNGSDEYKSLQHKIDSINRITVQFKEEIIDSYPELFIGKVFNATRDVKVPESILSGPDSLAPYRYLKEHYWDYLDLSDSRMLRTPMLSRKFDFYFQQLVPHHPDSVIADIDRVISLSRPSEEVKSWLLWQFMSKYQNPEYMGFDVVFIHLVDVYFSKEKVNNLTPSIQQTLEERADRMRPLVIGKPAPNLILMDTTGNFKSFRDLTNEYIVLYFWDYDCGICKKESKVLKELYESDTFDMEVYAINVNSDLGTWKQRLAENGFQWVNVNGTRSMTPDFHDLYDTHGTPLIYILDRQHLILAKNISADQIEIFLLNDKTRQKALD
ncbi:MAG: DUF5106 domain-containing protein [bacterium]